jgi:hypothetical protein
VHQICGALIHFEGGVGGGGGGEEGVTSFMILH